MRYSKKRPIVACGGIYAAISRFRDTSLNRSEVVRMPSSTLLRTIGALLQFLLKRSRSASVASTSGSRMQYVEGSERYAEIFVVGQSDGGSPFIERASIIPTNLFDSMTGKTL